MRSEAERELRLSIGALGALLVLTAFVAINLLQRMTPALNDVLEENVNSMDAARDMLASLAAARLPEEEATAARQRFRAALDAAVRHRTEPEEAQLIDELRVVETGAFRGEPMALQQALRALDALGRVNRAAAQRANTEAQRIETAGAWVVALIGVLGFGASLFVAQRLARRLLLPLHELSRVLAACEQGDRLQRCATRGTSASQHEMLVRLNRLLDTRFQHTLSDGALPESLSGLVPWLLDTRAGALALLDAEGRVLSANRAALEVLASESGPSVRESMTRAQQGAASDGVTMLQSSQHWALVELVPMATTNADPAPASPEMGS